MDDALLSDIAAAQHGAVSRHQLREIGLDRDALSRRRARGLLATASSRVVHVRGSADTAARRCWTAILDADGIVSHLSALAWWELPGFDLEPLHVTRLRGGRRRATHLATVHEPRNLLPQHLTTLRDVPVVTPARAFFDSAPLLPLGRLARALDTAWARGLVNDEVMARTLGELARKGRSGIRVMRSLIDERIGRPPVESGLESRFEWLCRRNSIHGFERQVDVGGAGWLGRSDFRHRRLPVVVFVDSALHHSALTDQIRDDEQSASLQAAGFVVVRVTDRELFGAPADVVSRIRTALGTARARRSGPPNAA